ncbi:hypothetical protein V1638_04165 [Pseudarthrobacter sp. J64]|uniref:hypothetical protein n=1 Tax=Pseudarthrobacter sp. J64 TaxID=3116485 RepID=UPI002E8164FE|nr:hypothetical protein [Pseudarthrobacter sp. J64]MEE2568591.1 hypothetical protein [Pseudarthrobacter sp. J64]
MSTQGLSSPIHLEYKYRVTADQAVELVPYRVAVLLVDYQPFCMYHRDEPIHARRKTHLCPGCIEAFTKYFRTIASDWAGLQDGLARSGRAASSERVGGTSDPAIGPLPINIDVSDAMGLARAAVWSTVGQLIQDRPDLRMPEDHSTDVLADWIARRHIDYLVSHPSPEHLHSVFVDIAKAAEAVSEQAYQCAPVEIEMKHNRCHQFTVNAKGEKEPCRGQLVGIMMTNGKKVVECDADPLHRVPADAWFKIQQRRASYRKRDLIRLQKKYSRRNG